MKIYIIPTHYSPMKYFIPLPIENDYIRNPDTSKIYMYSMRECIRAIKIKYPKCRKISNHVYEI